MSWVMGRFPEELRSWGSALESMSHAADCGDGHDEGLLERWRGGRKGLLE